jgi:hypothetical protein
MRMHPGVQYPLERVVPRGGATINGHFLPEGTIVGVNAAVIHRDRQIFGQDADEFRPERWLCDEEKAKVMDRHLLTVSHRCISSRLMPASQANLRTVRSGSENLYREKHFYHGNGKARSADPSPVRPRVGVG